MRILLDTKVVPDRLLQDPASSVYANLRGDFSHDVFPWGKADLHDAFLTSAIIAHEQRHYLDYYLTNYGSWLARYSPQLKQTIPAIFEDGGAIPVPIRFWNDADWAAIAGFDHPHSDLCIKAAKLAKNRAYLLAEDAKGAHAYYGSFAGGALLEALATAFEVGPIETWLDPGAWMRLAGRARDAARWRRDYVWPGQLFADIRFGAPPVPMHGGHVVESRLWPSVLVASLMGCFSDITRPNLDENPNLLWNVLPSRRFLRLVRWLSENPAPENLQPPQAWELVNTAAVALFDETVLDSFHREMTTLERLVQPFLELPPDERTPPMLEMLTHLKQRRQVGKEFSTTPLDYLDPRAYWSDRWPNPAVGMLPDYMLVSRSGFDVVPQGHAPTNDFPYRADIAGKPVFVKPPPASDFAARFETYDEQTSSIARILTNGCLSDSWVGPELELVQVLMRERGAMFIPPFGRQPR